MARRRFNHSERVALFLASGGLCSVCGTPLPAHWHADHRTPYSAGGPTDVTNGQALCPACNLSKGAGGVKAAVYDTWTARPFQAELVEWMLSKYGHPDNRIVVGDIAPGSGKSPAIGLGWATLRKEYPADDIVLVDATPRVNLCTQFEEDWMGNPAAGKEGLRVTFGRMLGIRLPGVSHRDNQGPFFGETDGIVERGYITTYQSLATRIDLHRHQLAGRKYVLVGDEAQWLGMDEAGGTKGAAAFKRLHEDSMLTVIISGTPNRADGMPLVLAPYTEPDDDGKRYLMADVTAPYAEGVEYGYLREFEFTVVDGFAEYQLMSGQRELRVVHDMDRGLKELLRHENFWRPLVDTFMRRVIAVKTIDSRFCGLIGAVDQRCAKKIAGYIRSKHGWARVEVAVSEDGKEAHRALRRFRDGEADVLITVGMAHVGFDHKPICVVCLLSAVREWGWLLQFFGRGLRVDGDTVLFGVGPNDPRFVAFAEWFRQQTAIGIKQREIKEGGGDPPEPREAGAMLVDSGVTDSSIIAGERGSDVLPEEMPTLEGWRSSYFLPGTPLSKIKAFCREQKIDIPQTAPRSASKTGGAYVSAADRWKAKKRDLSERFTAYDARLADAMGLAKEDCFGKTATACKVEHEDQGLPDCKTDADLEARHKWLDDVWAPMVEKWEREHVAV